MSFRATMLVLMLGVVGCGGWTASNLNPLNVLAPPTPEQVAEREAEAAKRREELKRQLEETDSQLATLVTMSQSGKRALGGLARHQGLCEVDSWGEYVVYEYSQDSLEEVMAIRSSGPDKVFKTKDDLVRTASTLHPLGSPLVQVWLICGLIAAGMFVLYDLLGRLNRKHRHTPAMYIAGLATCFLVAPIALLAGVVSVGATMLGSGFDLDPFDVDFNFDIDIDL